jgi:hypothetical protein
MWPKVLPHVKRNPYIINQNHIFSQNYCEVISGYILTNFTPNIQNCLYFDCLFAYYVYMSGTTANTNLIVFGLIRLGSEPTIYHTRGKHDNHYIQYVTKSIATSKTNPYKSKNWLTRNQINVSEWSDMSTHGLLLQWASTIAIQL